MHNWLRDLGWGLIGIKQDLSRFIGISGEIRLAEENGDFGEILGEWILIYGEIGVIL